LIKAIAFDMDGLMFDTERLNIMAWDYVSRKYIGHPISNELLLQICGSNMADSRRAFQAAYGEDFDFEGYRKLKAEYIQQHIIKNGMPVKPGLKELLDYLKDQGYGMIVATSTISPITRFNLQSANLAEYFDEIVCGDMVSRGKPEPDIYLKACEVLGFPPEECMALEDSANGITSAFRAGLKPVMIPDLLPPSEKISRMLYARFDSLKDVIVFLRSQQACPAI